MFFWFLDLERLLADKAWLPVERALAESRSRFPQLTVGALETLIYISRRQKQIDAGSLTLPKIARDLGVPYSTLARHTDLLGAGVGGREGLGLLKKKGGQGRVYSIEITPAGMHFLSQIYVALRPSQKENLLTFNSDTGSIPDK
ncbi:MULTISPECIES: hypothetical protein [Methylopilaceae]|uniref:MarR family transcriptional regulator n=2 Tax=Methylopilaceae TaxID=3149309 RepID=A0A4Q0M9T2_9HYPH|nr:MULTISPECIES: hypothetical protein [Methylocystaceae]QZO00557.1 hypothetical protein K6K41_02170 [Chenggangzhangella methanolivorans]RXF69971.1 hypothetical protein EK403_17755 [Hansschlegelia zhihuaiae]